MFMNTDFIEEQPEVVEGILEATAKGFADTMEDPRAAAQIMMEYLPAGEDMEVLVAQVEGTAATTAAPEGKPLGYQSEEAWRTMLETLKETGQIDQILPLDTYFTNRFFE
jgi:NitT/TauT family transport system substrate-binding protein